MDNFRRSFDVIVVGAGTGGSISARFAAKKGLKVCLIDTKERNRIGDKICGDAVGTEIFDFLNIKHPKNKELSCHIKGAKLYSPDQKKCITLTDTRQAGYIVNRLEFGQKQLNEALDSGVDQFLDNTKALKLIYNDKSVEGIKVKLNNGETAELKSKVLIDASGFYTPLRKQILSSLVESHIPKEDCILCYREILKFSQQDHIVQDPEYISITLNKEKAPGGYIWYFPKDDTSVNIGLGTFMHYKGHVKQLYKSNVFRQYIKTSKFEIISSGGGVVPVRRPLWSCIDNGLILVGDAACQVNPLHGGGIDPSMRAGYYAANATIEAFNKEDFSIPSLWNYNYSIMTTFGAEFASLDLLRMVLQTLSNEELNFGLSKDLLTSSEILEISQTGSIDLSFTSLLTKAIRGISNPNLLLDLNYLRIRMNEIFKIYKNFPYYVDDFGDWKEKVIQVYKKIKKNLINSKKKPQL